MSAGRSLRAPNFDEPLSPLLYRWIVDELRAWYRAARRLSAATALPRATLLERVSAIAAERLPWHRYERARAIGLALGRRLK